MLLIGLTGLIGSGKSTVAEIFATLGIPIIDTDLIAHQLTNSGGHAIAKIKEVFGAQFITSDGALERNKMRDLVFAKPDQRVILEQILHPLIFAEVQTQIGRCQTCPYIIVMVPLLFRSPKYLSLVKRSLFVDSNYDSLLERLKQRGNLQQSQVDAILMHQVPREKQLEMADDVIDNNGDKTSLLKQVQALHLKYVQANK